MSLRFSHLLAPAAFLSLCVCAQAQATFSTGGNVAVGAKFYRNSGGSIDTGTNYFVIDSNGTGSSVDDDPSFLRISSSVGTGIFSADSEPVAVDGMRVRVSLYDGSNPSSATLGNIHLNFTTYVANSLEADAFQMRFTFPETVAGDIGFISGWSVVTGSTSAGFENAFDYAFDGAGTIIITPNGSFTAVPFGSYDLSINLTVVPEPASAVVCAGLVAGFATFARRRRRA